MITTPIVYMKKALALISLISMISIISLPLIAAAPNEWHNMPKSGTAIGDTFEMRFEIKSDETTNYTIQIDPAPHFQVLTGNVSQTINIPNMDTRTFLFTLQIIETLENGKYAVNYTAFKNETIFKTDVIYVRAGQQVPGFEFVLFLPAILIGFLIWRKRQPL